MTKHKDGIPINYTDFVFLINLLVFDFLKLVGKDFILLCFF